ncbi:MAG: glycosyltransferase, partial [Propioniciclava sp.]
PLGRTDALDTASFAGTWYANYPDRCAAAETIMDAVLASGRTLTIHNRMSATSAPQYRFPERFQEFVHPAVTHAETANVFRASRFGITLNTVTDSRTMFARRAYELAAAGSVVLSNTAAGVQEVFGDTVIYADRDPEALQNLDESDYLERQVAAFRIAMRNTYRHRAEEILSTVGIPFQPAAQVDGFTLVDSVDALHRITAIAADERQPFEHVIGIASPHLPPTTFRQFLNSQTPRLSIIRLRDWEEGLRPRSFLHSPYGMFFDPNSPPDANHLDELVSVSVFSSVPVRRATDAQLRFRYCHTRDRSGVLFSVADINPVLDLDHDLSVFEV